MSEFDPNRPLHVVSEHWSDPQDPEETTWTVSQDQNCGWSTDCGCPGYGLTKADAQLIADRWNAALTASETARKAKVGAEG